MQQKFETILPEDFDGKFRFSNASDEDFIGKWGGREYLFPAKKRIAMMILDATPLETQNIRKKFARDYAEREFFKSKKYETFRLREGERDDMGMIKPRGQGMSHAGSYTESDLEPFIRQCLEPLPEELDAKVYTPAKDNLEDKLSRDDKSGELNTEVVEDTPGKRDSLRERALKGTKGK